MNEQHAPRALPVNLLIAGRLCLVVGGGRVALRKCLSLLAAGARVRLVSPAAVPDLDRLAAENRIEWIRRPFAPPDIQGALLVLACANDRAVNRRVLDECHGKKILCGCADGNWAESDFTFPAVTRHGGLTLAVATGGQSCRRARLVKDSLARHMESIETADLIVAGTDHRFLTLEQREPFHLDGPARARIGAMLMQLFGVHEFMLLNTCNRVEIMAVASHATAAGGLLCHALGFDRLAAGRYYQLQGAAAWEHSALVCAGMLSQTPGENHVAAQMKEALAEALRQGWAAGMTQEWMASVLHLSKHIKNDAAPLMPVCEIEDLALRLLGERGLLKKHKTLLVIGSGMVGRELVCNAAAAVGKIIWCYHRNPPELPEAWTSQMETCMIADLHGRLPAADAIVCAMDAPGFVLHGGQAALIGRAGPVTLVDLGVPRNIDPALGRLVPAADLVDVEGLKQLYGNGRDESAAAFQYCRDIIHAHREQYERLMQSFQGGNARQPAGADPATTGG